MIAFNISILIRIRPSIFLNREDFDMKLEGFLEEFDSDLIILAGFMRVLGKKITTKFVNKMINLHPSLLPSYPGLNTHIQVLKNNDKLHGISIHYVSPELDKGPLIAQGIIKVNSKLKEKIINGGDDYEILFTGPNGCLLYTSPSPRDS